MTDLEINSQLRQQWQQQSGNSLTESTPPTQSALRQLKRTKRVFVVEMSFSFFSIVFGLLFLLQGLNLVTAVSSVLLLLSGICSANISYRLRSVTLRWEDWSSEGLLEFNIQNCRSALRNAKALQLSSLMLLLFTLFIFVQGNSTDSDLPENFHLLYAGVSVPVVAFCLAWSHARTKGKKQQLISCQSALDEFRVGN